MRALEALTEINLDDLVSSFGWENQPVPAWLLRRVFHAPALKFARRMLAFDSLTGESTLPESASLTLRDYARELQVLGRECIPASGPVLFLSNHPGMVDTLALFTAINRPDLQVIALNRPFLLSLPNTARHLYFVSDDASDRMRAVKQAANHLRAGGALLTFPAGHIEPDPQVYPGMLESLESWTDSAGVFMRFAPETQIVPVLVSGVLWDKAVKFPLTKLKQTRDEREKLGAALQLLAHVLFDARPLRVTVQFAGPISLAEIGSRDLAATHNTVLERMRCLVQNPAWQARAEPA
jgi:1-acyl-sn-glycerol-3-phosphate acyltransferase